MGYDTYCFICGCCFRKKGISKENKDRILALQLPFLQ